MVDTLARCFSEGCGVSFETALTSPRYAEILAEEQALLVRFPADTDEGVALRAGLFRMGTLLNTLPEEQAIAEARSSSLDPTWNPVTRSMVRLLAETIIEAADQCLPDDIGELEVHWRNGDADAQVAVAGELFQRLLGEEQLRPGRETLDWSAANRHIHQEIRQNLDDDRSRVSPRGYGKWGDAGANPNCQGKSQMLLAFARRVGAPALCVNTIVSSSVVKDVWRNLVVRMIQMDIKERGATNIDPTFQESLESFLYVRFFESTLPDFFHIGVALQLRDGRWVLVDPHGLAWGVFPPAYRMEEISRLFAKYGDALPGLSLQAHDHQTAARLFNEQLREVRELLERSRKLEALLAGCSDLLEAFAIFEASGEAEWIAKREGLWEKIKDNPDVLAYYRHALFFGEEAAEHPLVIFDPEFLARRMGSLLTYSHCEVMNLFRDQLTSEGKLLHPEVELAPPYHIAMTMINSLSLADRLSSAHEFFLANSFDQLTFYNALVTGMPSIFRRYAQNPELAQAALQALSSLKLMHSACRERIERYFKGEKKDVR